MGINKQCWVGIEMLMKSDTLINNNETKGEYNSKTWWNWRRKVRVPKSFQFWKRWESFCFLHKLSIKQQLLNCHLSHLSWIVHQTSMRNLFKTLSLSKAQPWLWFWNWKLASYASMGESFLLLLSCTEEKILPPSPEMFWCSEEFREIVPSSVSSFSLGSAPQWLMTMTQETQQYLNKSKSNAWTISWGGLRTRSETLGHWREGYGRNDQVSEESKGKESLQQTKSSEHDSGSYG